MSQLVHALRAQAPIDRRPIDPRIVRQVVQAALLGFMDGAVSTLAPIFATAGLTHDALSAFLVGLAGALGAGVSMGLAEAVSDDGVMSGRGDPLGRGLVTGGSTAVGGILHALPFLLGSIRLALDLAYVVVIAELAAIAFVRFRYMDSPFGKTVLQVIAGGAVVLLLGAWLGRLGVSA
jgi:VIT1/CCC1 family predicted Fe2+/Mn2+ transporter